MKHAYYFGSIGYVSNRQLHSAIRCTATVQYGLIARTEGTDSCSPFVHGLTPFLSPLQCILRVLMYRYRVRLCGS